MNNDMSTQAALPIIDFTDFASSSKTDTMHIAQSIHKAISTNGFFYLTGHELHTEITNCFDAAHWFFNQPISEKQKIHISKSPCHRGWYAQKEEILDICNNPDGDIKEGIKIGNDLPDTHPFVQQGIPLHGANQWPDNSPQAQVFKKSMQSGYKGFLKFGTTLMHAIALGLELQMEHFTPFFKTPMATLSPIYYPPIAKTGVEEQKNMGISAGAHTDFGCLSILAQDSNAGLQIQSPDGSWKDIPPLETALVINIGDMFEYWTGGLYRSTQHRVINQGQETRCSLVFFLDPQYNTPLTPITHMPTNTQPTHNRPTALEHLLKKIDTSFSQK